MARSAHNTNPLTLSSLDSNKNDNRRRHGRLRCEGLLCDLGQIQDLSASGFKMFRKGKAIAKQGETIVVVIQYLDATMPVQVKTIRAEKVGFRKHLYGFEFIELTDEQRQRITALARVATDTLAFVHLDSA